MSTRAHIELYDAWYEGNEGFLRKGKPPVARPKVVNRFGVRLYHHADGYPDFMRKKLKKFLPAAYEYLKEAGYPYWWDSERVAAVLIALSIEDYEEPLKPFSTDRCNTYSQAEKQAKAEGKDQYDVIYRPDGGVPYFQPCYNEHSDIEYVWKVVLGPEEGKFKISHKHVIWSDEEKKLVTYTEAERKKRYARLGIKE